MKIATLADVRVLIEQHLPEHCRTKDTWRYVAARLSDAAGGGDPIDVAIPLRMILSMEGVECRP
jgi:hypothetical protein